ncbi:MAG: hypothetical protein D6812_03075, partial [Deltaproteobacteria bacterium]
VIHSTRIASYEAALDGFLSVARQPPLRIELSSDSVQDAILERIGERPVAVVVAIGVKAARFARKAFPGVPMVFCMIRDPQRYGLLTQGVTGVLLEIPVQKQLEVMHTLFPEKKRIGVIYNPKNSRTLVDAASGYARISGFEFVEAKVDRKEEVPRILRIFPSIDLFWLVKDSTVIHPDAFEAIEAYMRKHRIPMMASSADLVPYGAMMALSFDYTGLGKQTYRMVETLLSGRRGIDEIPVENPRDLVVVCNRKVVATFALKDFEARLRALQEKSGFRIEWYGAGGG